MASFCSNCGQPLASGVRHCQNCGQATGGAFSGGTQVPPSAAQRKLVRPRAGRKIAGVCQGIANLYGWDPMLVRVIFVLLAFVSGIGLVAYAVVWAVAPEEPVTYPVATQYRPPPQS